MSHEYGTFQAQESARGRYVIASMIFAAALIVRIVYLWQFHGAPFYDPQATGLDPFLYDQVARRIASGDWIGQGVFDFMPAYGYLLGIVYSVGGTHLFLAYLVQSILSAASVSVLFLLACRLMDVKAAVVAAALGCFSQTLVFHTGMLTGDALGVFLAVLAMYLASIAPEIELRRKRWFLLLGLITGVGMLTRGFFSVFAVLFVAWIAIVERKSLIARALPAAASFLIGVILMVAPVTVRNYVVGGDFVVITAHDGMNVYLGYNPRARGGFQPVPELGLHQREMLERAQELAERVEGRALKPSESSAFWKHQAWKFVKKNPMRSLGLVEEKILTFFNAYEISDVIALATMKEFSWFLKFCLIPIGAVIPFSLLGMGVCAGRRKYWPVYLFVAANLIAVIVTFVNARYRLTAVPALLIFAGAGGEWIVKNVRSKKRLLMTAAALIIGGVVAYQPLLVGDKPSVSAFNLANAYMHVGKRDLAEIEFLRAIELDPTYYAARFNLGALYWEERNVDYAESQFLQVLALHPDDVDALNMLGNISLFRDDTKKALEYWKKSLEINPDQPEVREAIEQNKLTETLKR